MLDNKDRVLQKLSRVVVKVVDTEVIIAKQKGLKIERDWETYLPS